MQKCGWRRYLRELEAALLIAFVLTVCLAMVRSAERAKPIRDSVLRLHILADSDEEQAQQTKLIVRDAVLTASDGLLAEAGRADSAEELVRQHLTVFEQAANASLEEQGAPYRASVSLEDHYFPTRSYGGISLPAGTYRSLVIRLGRGEGRNWWCVMFPPLCYNGEDVEANAATAAILQQSLPEEEYRILTEDAGGVKVKFRLLELFGSAAHALGLDGAHA